MAPSFMAPVTDTTRKSRKLWAVASCSATYASTSSRAASRFSSDSMDTSSALAMRVISRGYRLRRLSSEPKYSPVVEETVTSTIMDRMQMEASPAPLRFMR